MKVNPFSNHNAQHYIDGRWLKGEGLTLSSQNPATGELIWQGNEATASEVASAFGAASHALSHWANQSFATRANYLEAFAKQVTDKRQALTELISLETGKPLWEAATEVTAVINKVKFSLQAYQERTSPQEIPSSEANAFVRFKPHGIVAVLGAFNFPAHLSNGHIVPALLAGNTVIFKPSELAPAVGQFMLQCWHESGIPNGVINGVQGGIKTGQALLNTNLQGVYFTGSYKTGLKIHQHFSNKPEVILALEMGGNNPLIIDEVKNQQAAIYNALLSSMITAGQRCSCARRLLIADTAYGDEWLSQFVAACKNLKLGPYTDQPEPFMGPVIRHEQALNHLNAQDNLISLGGKAILSMSLLKDKTGLLSPGVIDMTGVHHAPDEEIFAPFVQVYRYKEFEEALDLANQTAYGLVAGLLSDNASHYELFYQRVRAGLINWNRPTTGALSSLPFGGVGHSGNHRPSAYFAADYCAYPVASLEQAQIILPTQLLPGIDLGNN